MEMHARVAGDSARQEVLARVHLLLVAALDIIDQMDLPAMIGAQVDQSLHTLRSHLDPGYAPAA
jgi:hypothetical protein